MVTWYGVDRGRAHSPLASLAASTPSRGLTVPALSWMAPSLPSAAGRRRRPFLGSRSDAAEEDMPGNVPPTIHEEDGETVIEEKPSTSTARAIVPEIYFGVFRHNWNVVEQLSAIPILQHFLQVIAPLHDRLKRENWVYLVLFVYMSCIYYITYRIITFPVVNLQVAKLGDRALAWIVMQVLNVFPVLASPYQPRGGTISAIYRALHPSADSRFLSRATSTMAGLALRVQQYVLLGAMFVLMLYSRGIVSAHRFINGKYALEDTPTDQMLVAVYGRIIGFFWRYPYNMLYSWLLLPLVIQPTQWLQVYVDDLQMVLDGSLVKSSRKVEPFLVGSAHKPLHARNASIAAEPIPLEAEVAAGSEMAPSSPKADESGSSSPLISGQSAAPKSDEKNSAPRIPPSLIPDPK